MRRIVVLGAALLLVAGCRGEQSAPKASAPATGEPAAAAPAAGQVGEMAQNAAQCLDLVAKKSYAEAVPICTAALQAAPENLSVKSALEQAKAAVANAAQEAASQAAQEAASKAAQGAAGQAAGDAAKAAEGMTGKVPAVPGMP